MTTCVRCNSENVEDWSNTVDGKHYCKNCGNVFYEDDNSVPVPDLYTYMRQASRTLNPATKLKLSEQQVRLLNLSLGLSEVGELQNLIKKMIFHGHEVNVEKLMDEIGDIQWYLFMIMRELGIDPYAVLRQNITKLRERYPNGFSHEDSIKRKDVKK